MSPYSPIPPLRSFTLTLLFLPLLLSAQKGEEFEFEVKGMSCEGCAKGLTKALEEKEGVEKAEVDYYEEKAIVRTDGSVKEKELHELVEERNFEALREGESLPSPISEEQREDLDIRSFADGEPLDPKEHVAEKPYTIFFFHAEWCGPCKVYGPKLEHLLLDHPQRLALRKFDLLDWKSGLGEQMTEEYDLPALPFTLVFDRNGKLIDRITGNRIEEVKELVLDD